MTIKDIVGIIFCISPIAFIGFIIVAVILGVRADTKRFAKEKAEDEKWLEEEKAKPRSHVQFRIEDSSLRSSGDLEPSVDGYGMFRYRTTSEGLAERHLKACYERGFFRDECGVTYPACNIMDAQVAESKNEQS